MSAYYNEHDPGKASWLRELIKARVIAPGEVDERDIQDVRPDDLIGFEQCHFFAGIGVWSYALRLAGWPDDQPVWTGSCPCQPFSAAGKGAGFTDERHLWPSWFHLIEERRPRVVFGEQVASPDGLAWLDLVSADMEAAGYAFGPADICAAGVGAPHIRQRLWFVADSDSDGCGARRSSEAHEYRSLQSSGCSDADELANISRERCGEGSSYIRWLATGDFPQRLAAGLVPGSHVGGFWANADWIRCRDGKYRPIEPGTFPLAHGAPTRVGRLRGYGDAIVAPLAAEVIRAYMAIA